ncbi:pre-peptidase C-terminal domain-containing protein [Leptolyngbya sp. FACHB-671]|nr:ELWxxDGT repeat protein [Leptolyngbya sp. FACHB-671]MBD1871814.1 pre-peptidase C-terminal domain-containing protein [Cyanobacteria bacterium FACHB-471]MBD2069850.1 pre-peptidase C-terminal domain-containing protein [Leptolyngbya sp. FACHB-671]
MADAGNTLQEAKRVAFSRGFARYSDSLTPTDRNDYYRIDIRTRKSLSARVFGLTGNADLALYGSRGGVIRPTSRQPLTREENINLTVDPGTYYLRVFTPEATTTTRYALTLSAFDDNAGNSQTRARALGDITGVVNRVDYTDFVGVADLNDFYSFTVSDRRTVNASIRGLRGDADLYLRDSAGNILQQSVTAGTASEVITRALNGPLTNGNPVNDPTRPVTYFLQVVPKAGVRTGYTLGISTGPEAGATVAKARSIDLTFDSQTYSDGLGDGDNIDLYSFRVDTPSDFNLRLDGFNATLNADVQLYRNDGSIAPFTPQNLVASSVQGGLGIAESLTNQRLTVGDYLIRVSRFGNTGNSSYNLTLSGLPGDRAPNTIQTARNLNLSSTNIRAPFTLTGTDGAPEFINPADRLDFYKVDLNSGGRTFLSIRLTNLPNGNLPSGTADLLLLQDSNNDGVISDSNGSGTIDLGDEEVISVSTRTGSSPETIGGTFQDGTYYLAVRPGVEGQASFYDLSAYTAPGGTVPSITRDILFGAGSSDPREFTDVNGSLYFIANDGEGYALWKSEGVISSRLGTVQTTAKVRVIKPGATEIDISGLTNVNGTLYFAADDGVNGTELWKSDGTAAGTVLVKNINTLVGGSSLPSSLTAVGDTLYFVASDQGNNFELWKSDGTEAGTVQVADLATLETGQPVSSSPDNLTNVNGTLFFTATTRATGRELYRLDPGSTAPQLLEITEGNTGSFPENLTVVNDTGLYFTAFTDANGLEIWKIGASGIPVRVTEFGSPTTSDSEAASLTAVGSQLYFTAVDGNFREQLWSIDTARADALTQLTNVDGGANPSSLVNVNGTLYFSATKEVIDGVDDREIWSTNGTATGTTAKTSIDSIEFNPSNLIDVNGVLYFTANDGNSGTELWRYNPESSNPRAELVSDIIPGAIGSNPEALTNISGRLFFRADNSSDANGDGVINEQEGNGIELWGL